MVVSTEKCICCEYNAYMGVGIVVPIMTAEKLNASRTKAAERRRRAITTQSKSPAVPCCSLRDDRCDSNRGELLGPKPHASLRDGSSPYC
ncbi:Uncharacterised protein [Mycobacteroides abscessus]|nr:Uncharacterised protein [Mycobacteroides abscessus]SHV18779.1 Uncharacterised protein [Mycobacteroides abscessus subsp. abscessus]SIK62835.1 Uncharacterised protein [Mycobacteroides abscessus subsp. abscessus]